MSDVNTQPVAGENGRPPRDNLFRAAGEGTFELRAADGDGGPVLFGHFARFNEWTEIDSIFEGRFMERFSPGAFKKTISENRDQMRVLFQHGRDPQIGNKPLGSISELSEDDEGAHYEVSLLEAPYVREQLLPGLKAGLYGASFRFRVVREEFNNEPPRSDHNPEGIPERTVKEAQVMEFGPVTFPAYQNATAGVRSLTDEFFVQRLAAQPERLRRLIEWLDSDPSDSSRTVEQVSPPVDADPQPQAEGEGHLERDTEDTAPPEETPEHGSTSPQGRRDNSTGLVLPRTPKPTKAGVLPNRDQGEQPWSPIRLP